MGFKRSEALKKEKKSGQQDAALRQLVKAVELSKRPGDGGS